MKRVVAGYRTEVVVTTFRLSLQSDSTLLLCRVCTISDLTSTDSYNGIEDDMVSVRVLLVRCRVRGVGSGLHCRAPLLLGSHGDVHVVVFLRHIESRKYRDFSLEDLLQREGNVETKG